MRPFAELLGDSPEITAVRDSLGRLLARQRDGGRAPSILIQGETGTGKTVLARAIHRAGPRSSGPFVDVNCAAIPDTLLESELFGYERGAFTDARQGKPGLFHAAHRGTIFLDEIGLLPESLQSKLLTVIEERSVRRLGSTRAEPTDVALVTATAVDLPAAVRARRFREDLYHRLAVITLTLPPLRARHGDIVPLAEHFLARAIAEYRLARKTLAADARDALTRYDWPGNVRELANLMERVALMSDEAVVTAAALDLPAARPVEVPPAGRPDDSLDERVRAHMVEVLERNDWKVARAARVLGIARNTLRARIDRYGLRREPTSPRPSTGTPPSRGTSPATAAPRRWQPRRVTLLRADVAASRAAEFVVEKVRSFGGEIVELGPTSVVGAFGLEVVEDAPVRAAHAATAIQRAAARANVSGGDALPIRVVLHVGDFLVGLDGATPGIAPDAMRPARALLDALVTDAAPGIVAVSESAVPFFERRFELTPLPGAGGARPLYRLEAPDRTVFGGRRRLSALVGRDHEVATLGSLLEAAVAGQAHVVGIVGEAGIGKSRLVYELRRRVAGRPILWADARCTSYGSAVPYLPVLEILRHQLAVTEDDDPEALAAKVTEAFAAAGLGADHVPYVLQLFGVTAPGHALATLSPEAVKARTFDALRRYTLARSREAAAVHVIEDLHWIDPTSDEYLNALVEGLGGAPILIIATYRPGYRPRWIVQSYATQLALRPLTPHESRTVVHSLVGDLAPPEPVIRVVLERSDGNPFFLEELSRTVTEQHDPAHPGFAVPDTVQELLVARVNRLADEPRRLLQVAAVLGRRAPSRLLQALWDEPLEPPLGELTRLEFLRPDATAEPGWAFTHALVQEVAYDTIAPEDRRRLHAAAARAIETQYRGRLDDVLDRLAHHYSRAEAAGRAIDHLVRLADRAARAYAHAEAAAALEQALTHVAGLPDEGRDRRHLELVLRLVDSLTLLGRFAEIVGRLFENRDRFERCEDAAVAGPYHFWLGRASVMLGDAGRALDHAQRALAAADRVADDATAGRALYVLGFECFWSGRPAEGIEYGRQAVARLERARDSWWIAHALWMLAVIHSQVGEFAVALDAIDRGLAIGAAIEDRRLQSMLGATRGAVLALTGDTAAALAACRRGLELAPDPVVSAMAHGLLGAAYLEADDVERAIPALEASIEGYRRFGMRQMQGWFTTLLGEAWLRHGDTRRAETLAAEGLEVSESIAYRFGIGWAERVLGRIASATGRNLEALKWFGRAADTFGAMNARYDGARTRVDLGRLAARTGDAAGAATHLAEALATFEALGLPAWVARTRAVAAELGLRDFSS